MANDPIPAPAAPDPEEERSEAFAQAGFYPNRSPCPVGCKFCYERSLPEFYPKLKVGRVRPKSLKQFEFYSDQVEKFQTSAIPTAPVIYDAGSNNGNGGVVYHSYSDFFAQGLTLEQIDTVVAANTRAGAAPYVSTMGKGFDFEMAKYLQEKHPDAFRVRLSVLTYNDEIKATLIPRWTAENDMKRITSILRYAHIYLLHFNCDQTLEDLREVNRLANKGEKPNVGIAVVHYTRLHGGVVQKYANEGFADFEKLVRHLASGEETFENINDIHFQHPAEGFTFRFRNWLRTQLAPHALGSTDLVLCSRGALQVMRDLVIPPAHSGVTVKAIGDSLGGSTSFTTTMQTNDFIRDLKAMGDGLHAFKRVFVPGCVWWVDGNKCLGSGTIDDLRAEFPNLEIIPIDVPNEIQDARLSIRQAYDWYNADLTATREALDDAKTREAIQAALAPGEVLTELGFVRRFSDDVVEYDELLVETSDAPKPHDDDGEKPPPVRFHVGSRIFRRTPVRRFPVEDRALFDDVFVHRTKSPHDTLYRTLADLERRILS